MGLLGRSYVLLYSALLLGLSGDVEGRQCVDMEDTGVGWEVDPEDLVSRQVWGHDSCRRLCVNWALCQSCSFHHATQRCQLSQRPSRPLPFTASMDRLHVVSVSVVRNKTDCQAGAKPCDFRPCGQEQLCVHVMATTHFRCLPFNNYDAAAIEIDGTSTQSTANTLTPTASDSASAATATAATNGNANTTTATATVSTSTPRSSTSPAVDDTFAITTTATAGATVTTTTATTTSTGTLGSSGIAADVGTSANTTTAPSAVDTTTSTSARTTTAASAIDTTTGTSASTTTAASAIDTTTSTSASTTTATSVADTTTSTPASTTTAASTTDSATTESSTAISTSVVTDTTSQTTTTAAETTTAEGYYEEGGMLFWINTESWKSWDSSKSECQSKGGQLFSIDTAAKADVLFSILGGRFVSGQDYVWLGCTATSKPSEWVWESGVAIATASGVSWQPGQPDSSGDCCYIQRGTYGIDDSPCSSEMLSICQIIQ